MKSQTLSAPPAGKKRANGRKKGLWLVLAAVLLLAGGAAGWYFWTKNAASSQAAAQTGATSYTSTVQRGDIRISISGSGTLTAYRSYDLSFSTQGTVVELDVKLGDRVKAGQVLARLDQAGSLEADVASAKVQLLEAQQALTELQQNGDVALAQAYQDWTTAQAAYNEAAKTEQQTTGKRCSTQVTAQYTAALEKAKAKAAGIDPLAYGTDIWTNAKNDLDQAQANYDYCIAYTADEKSGAASALQVARTALDQAEQKYNTLKAAAGVDPNELALDETRVEEAKSLLADAQEKLAGITLTAPIDGKVISLAASQGAIVDTTKFITVADISRPMVKVSVDESDMDRFVVGASASVTFDALPEQTFTGKVTQVDPELTTSGQYKITTGWVELDSSAAETLQTLPLGLNGTVTIIEKEAENALLVPAAAMKDLGDSQYAVFVKGSDGQLKMQVVQIGIQTENFVEVTSGLNEGDVVSTGLTKANANPSDANSSAPNTLMPGDVMQPMDGGGMPPMP